MIRPVQYVTLVGFGAIGRAVLDRLRGDDRLRITHVVVREGRIAEVQALVGAGVHVVSQVPPSTRLLIECAGHSALVAHVLPALRAGIECAVVSSGAMADDTLAAQLAEAAGQGGTQLHLIAGAVAGVDAIAAARSAGIDSLVYTGRKPPAAWRGSPAEAAIDLDRLGGAVTFFEGTARDAARLYPKNANVAAILAIAGPGLDATRVRLIADPAATANTHEVEVVGVFGELRLVVSGKPLSDNPKTSALTVLSVLRFLHNRIATITV